MVESKEKMTEKRTEKPPKPQSISEFESVLGKRDNPNATDPQELKRTKIDAL
jgi:hypothetical protein